MLSSALGRKRVKLRRRAAILRGAVSRARLAGPPLAFLLSLAGAAVYWRWSRRALPQVDGEVAAARAERARHRAPRRPGRASHPGRRRCPTSCAPRGYVTAQDRMWQMDLLRRRAEGQLAEAFGVGGPGGRPRRAHARAGPMRPAAPCPRCRPTCASLIDAYADGVNAWLVHARRFASLEFRLLRYAPRPWEVADSLAVGKLLALDLAQGWEDEALRAHVRSPARGRAGHAVPKLFAQDRILVGQDVAVPAGGAEALTETARGSNNWVISGAHTASGRPLLANDPHLALGVPSIWAAVHLTSPEMDVAGVVLPGTPGVTLGRNRRIAWGCTNVHDDSADLYVEEFDPRDPDLYRTADGWERVQVRHEAIRVREGALSSTWRTVDHVVRSTRRGPLVTIGARQYALRWTALADDAVELTAFARLQRAGDWNEFREAVRLSRARAELRLRGRGRAHRLVRRRPHAHPARRRRRAAVPGASADGDWLGFVPFDALPHVFDPPVRPDRHREQPPRRHRLPLQGDARRHRSLARSRPLRGPGGARGLDDGRLRPAPGRAAVPSPPRSRAGVARGGGPAPRRRRPGTRSRARWEAGTDASSRAAAAPPRWPCSPSARSARA